MRLSKYFVPTLKEEPKDAEIISHKYMVRAGMIRKIAAGIYDFLPMGLRVVRKVETIVREEMDKAGALEVLMPVVIPGELWEESGRWNYYGKELLRIKDRKEGDFCIGPTHEEVVTDMVRRDVKSYKELPVNIYQIQTKFRDEIRPRFGLMRGREFIMKDAYSFDADQEGLSKSYDIMYDTYSRIFKRCGLEFKVVEADTGNIGGSDSHEFMVIAKTGEDELVSCPKCNYSANVEKAEFYEEIIPPSEKEKALEKIETVGKKTIEEVSEFLKISAKQMIKTLVYSTDKGNFIVLIRGDYTVNEIKLKNILDVPAVTLADDETVNKITHAPKGFAGPVGLNYKNIIIDQSVLSVKNGVTGANEKDFHFINVNINRDFKIDSSKVYNIRLPVNGDKCPKCKEQLEFFRGIEVGHIFKLGTKYSESMNATFLDKNGKEKHFIMGCYGIGVTRIAAAAIEQNNDKNGIIWPLSIAPYQVIVIPTNWNNDEVKKIAENIYQGLINKGIEVVIDDRNLRAGFKFKDADLVGYPFQVVVGERGLKNGIVELKNRSEEEKEEITVDSIVEILSDRIKTNMDKYL